MRWLLCACVMMALTGCRAYYVDINGRIDQRASAPIDQQSRVLDMTPTPKTDSTGPDGPIAARFGQATPQRDILRTSFENEMPQPDKDKKGPKGMLEKLEVPEGVLGYKQPDIKPPPPKATEAEMKK